MIVCQNCRTENTDDVARCASCGESPTLAPKTLSANGPRDPNATATGFTYPVADGPAAPVAAAGTKIADRYELRALLGRGGMGLVYKARDLVLDEDTAIKLLQPHLMREVGDIERLKREITTARKITHGNVIRIHDFGLAGEEGFISMEILSGGTLHERLAKGAIPIPEAVDIALGIAEGLGAAHAQGVIHRDIKPHNVLFDDKGVPKLADFGLARLASATSQTMGFSGTPQYMSPELADGREITPRSDVYSAGVLFYELLAGKPPFQADSLLRLATLHSKEPPPPLRQKRADVPPALEQIVMRALEKDPARRFEDGRALAAALRDFKSGATVQLPPLPGKPRRMMALLGGFGVALFAGCVAYELYTGELLELLGAVGTPTPVAVITQTPAPATPAPTPAPSVAPSPIATVAPKPSPTRKVAAVTATATPKPTQAAVAVAAKPALLSVRAIPWGEVYIGPDAQRLELAGDDSNVFTDRPFPAGRYWLRVRSPSTGQEAGTWIELKAGERVFLSANLATGVFTRK